MSSRDLIVHIASAGEVEISDGIVYIRERSGGRNIERTMSVRTAQKTVERFQRALERYAAGEQNVIVGE